MRNDDDVGNNYEWKLWVTKTRGTYLVEEPAWVVMKQKDGKQKDLKTPRAKLQPSLLIKSLIGLLA